MGKPTSHQEAASKQVLDHHVGAFALGIDALLYDYDDTSVIITPEKAIRGLSPIRSFWESFLANADDGFWTAFKVNKNAVLGGVAYLIWEAAPSVALATDTFFIREGKILVQTRTTLASSP
ncbi:nuclear transport factor 2 family protein [Caballeronia sp. LjRoot34]|uniref:nuclear transport factor 2 family protein n=1 Tax=Caballeronia sp. LjRoot34 TaxID=3342325 RepID=UPI003ECFFE13